VNENTPKSATDSNSQSFELEPRQKKIYKRLFLVGSGAAEFYYDACRLMSDSTVPAFGATTHLVGHLVREVESSMRDVLEPFTGRSPSQIKKCDKCDSKIQKRKTCIFCKQQKIISLGHKDEIKLILKGLGIKSTDPVAKAWLDISKKGLHKLAHRSGLNSARKISPEFMDFWNGTERVLDGILDVLEAKYTVIFKKIDEIIKKNNPSQSDADYLYSNVPNTLLAQDRIFKNLDNSKWLPLLRKKKFFDDTPQPIYGEYQGSQTVSYPAWPAATYLKKMASVDSVAVRDILLKIPETKNETVKASLLEISLELSTADRKKVFQKMKTWMDGQQHYYVNDATNNLFLKSIEEGEMDVAFEAAVLLLDFKPDPRSNNTDENEFAFSYDPISRLDEWHYERFINGTFQKIVKADPIRSFDLLSQMLANFVSLKYKNRKQAADHEDYMYISRPAIEDHEQNRDYHQIENSLITSVRDIADSLIIKNKSSLKKIIKKLEDSKWTIFKRIAIYLISKYPSVDVGLTNKYLANPEFFDKSNVEHEYVQLMDSGFRFLTPKNKERIFKWIKKAEYPNELIRKMTADSKENISDDYTKKKLESWEHEQLYFLRNHLKGKWKKRYQELSKEYQEPKYPGFPSYMSSYSGPSSVVNAVSIEEMDETKLLELLKSWKPDDGDNHFGPSKDGLGRELGIAIKRKPDFFVALAEKFIGLDPTYIRSYIYAFQELIQNDYDLNWDSFLSLCEWVIEQPIVIEGRTGDVFDQDPDWEWTRKAVASLLSRGLNDNDIPYRLRERVWKVIEPLTTDPNPTPEQEVDSTGKKIRDAYSLTINTTRGDAVSAVVEYALWVHRSIEATEDGKEKLKVGFKNMPEVQEILDYHLDPKNDPSIAVRAVYGRFFPWLLLLDRTWTIKSIPDIFPNNKFGTSLYGAAWETYVCHVPAYNEPFDLLMNEYKAAVLNLGKKEVSDEDRHINPEEHLANHLMTLYWRGKINLDDEILVNFWKLASNEIRGFAIDSLGRGILDEKVEVPPETIKRLMTLWESRLKAAEASSDKSQYEREMSAFGWWFASNKFDHAWVSDQYLRALNIGIKTQSDYYVTKQLVRLVPIIPIKTIEILEKLIETQQKDWVIFGNKTEIRKILSLSLRSPDPEARKKSEELINRIVSKGYTEFEDLLKDPPPEINLDENL